MSSNIMVGIGFILMICMATIFACIVYMSIMALIIRVFGMFGICLVAALNTLGPILLIACLI